MNRLFRTYWTQKRVLVIGDLMVDTELVVSPGRPSPEGKGEVVRQLLARRFPGGAANVAMNCRSLGAHVDLLGATGSDGDGQWLAVYLQEQGIRTPHSRFAYRLNWERTTVKTRITRDGVTLLRVDRDAVNELAPLESRRWIAEQGPYDALLLSDYQKGAFTNRLMVTELLRAFRQHHPGAVIGVNPKPALLSLPLGPLDLVSVNASEYRAALLPYESLSDMACRLNSRYLLRTQGDRGLWLAGADGTLIQQGPLPVAAIDPVGCGDATFAAAALALTVTDDLEEIARIANAAGAAKVAKRGTAPVSAAELFSLLNFTGSEPFAGSEPVQGGAR